MAETNSSIGALIADGEAQSIRFLRLLLESVGVKKIWEAKDGESAFELYLQHQPAIIVVDLNMHVVSGNDLAGRVVVLRPEAVAGVMRSPRGTEVVQQLVKLGATVHILKQQPKSVEGDVVAGLLESVCTVEAEMAGADFGAGGPNSGNN